MAARLLRKILKKVGHKKTTGPKKNIVGQPESDRRIYETGELKQIPVSPGLDDNLDILKSILGRNSDVIIRRFRLGIAEQARAAVIYMDGMSDVTVLNNDIMKPLMLEARQAGINWGGENLLEQVKNLVVSVSALRETCSINDVISGILYGDTVLLIDGQAVALHVSNKGWSTRQIAEPQSEVVVRGPKEGFTEDLRTNVTMIRRRLRSPNLILEDYNIGRVTSTGVAIAYIRGIVSPDTVAEVKRRLQRIDIDGVMESGYLEEFIEDMPYSPFPQVVNTERPDAVAVALLQGRVAILTDGTPFALVVPATIFSFLQSPEDYYDRFTLGTAIRWLRYIAFAASLLLPSLYIAITTFHQEMIPTLLLLSLAAAREGVPFPALVEALLMEFTFEALREAGIRLPRAVGQAVSIVGALVIGQAAVQAGIVSPLMVIVVAITGIASFMTPSYSMAITIRLLRFPIMLLAATLGLFGVMMGILAILIHLAGLRSFGVPYLAPLAPMHMEDLKDVVVRAPWWAQDTRPVETAKLNRRRQARGLKPSPPKTDGGKGGGRG